MQVGNMQPYNMTYISKCYSRIGKLRKNWCVGELVDRLEILPFSIK